MLGGSGGVERARVEVVEDATDKFEGMAVDQLLVFIASTLPVPRIPGKAIAPVLLWPRQQILEATREPTRSLATRDDSRWERSWIAILANRCGLLNDFDGPLPAEIGPSAGSRLNSLFLKNMIKNVIRLWMVVLPLGLFLVSCDQRPKTAAKAAPEKKKSSGPVEPRFKAARAQMLAGQYAEAAAALAEIDEDPNIRQPLHNWITLHHGFALLLADREKDSRAVFAKIEDRGLFSKDERNLELANFFVNLAHLLRAEEPVAGTVAKDYDKWTYEGIALLLLGLKDWGLEKFDDSIALFRQFDSVMPDKMVEWASGPEELKILKQIGEGCVADFSEFKPAMDGLKAAKTPEEQLAAVGIAKTARAKMKIVTKRSAELDAMIADLGPKATALIAEKNKMTAAEESTDAKAMVEAKQKRTDLISKFLFAEARQAILDPNLVTEKARDEQQLLAKKTSWLANYKAQLIEDLNAKGYAAPLKTKTGAPLSGAIAKADAQQLMLRSPRGLVPMPWSELSLESAYAMGLSFILPDMAPDIVGFRKWHLGVFASFAGKEKESQALLGEASELRPLYKDELPLFAPGAKPW